MKAKLLFLLLISFISSLFGYGSNISNDIYNEGLLSKNDLLKSQLRRTKSYANESLSGQEYYEAALRGALLDNNSDPDRFLTFDDLTRIGEKTEGHSNGELAGLYRDRKGDTWLIKKAQNPVNEYLGSKLMDLLIGPRSPDVKLLKDFPRYTASKVLPGFIMRSDITENSVEDIVKVVGALELDVAMDLIGLGDRNDKNMGYVKRDNVFVATRVDFDHSFNFLGLRGVGSDPYDYNSASSDSSGDGLAQKDGNAFNSLRGYRDSEEEMIALQRIMNVPDEMIFYILGEGYNDLIANGVQFNYEGYEDLPSQLIARKSQLQRMVKMLMRLEEIEADTSSYTIQDEEELNAFVKETYQPSLLHFVARSGLKNFTALLLTKGADPNVLDSDGATPLHWAVEGKQIDVIKLLLEGGADPKVQDSEVLVHAVYVNDFELTSLLLEAGADPKASNSRVLAMATEEKYSAIFDLLLKAGADPSRALINVIHFNKPESVKRLLAAGADPRIENSQALMNSNNIEIIKLLLDAGADPKAQDSAALRYAVYSSAIETVKLLLKAGADPKAEDSQVLAISAMENHKNIFDLLLKTGADPSRALIKVYGNNPEAIKLLLNAGADPNVQDSQVLIKAAQRGYFEMVKLLLEAGADPKAQDSLAVVSAAENGHHSIVELFVKMDAATSSHLKLSQVIGFINEGNLEGFISMEKSGKLDISNPVLIKKILLSKRYPFVKYFFDNVEELQNAYLIGFNHFYGEWSANVLKVITDKDKSNKNAYIVDISLEIAQDDDIMQHFSGFINPGAGDSYPRHQNPFTIAELKESKMIDHEKVYQQVITMAKKHDIPYLGVCAGAQHLVLNSKGSLKKGGHEGLIKVNFIPGTIPHFLFLTEEEKAEALSDCKLQPIEITDASTAHNYAGYREDLGPEIKLAAISEDGIPEAFSLGANKIGVQFHPENYYRDSNYSGLNRHQQFLDSVIGIFEGYYRSMQYAKKMGIDRVTAKAAIRKVNQELVDHLENCAIDGNNIFANTTLWGKGQNIQHESKWKMKKVSLLPGITPEDIAITKDAKNNLIVNTKDERGRLTILDRIDSAHVPEVLRMEFADGSVIELDPAEAHRVDTSFSGERLIKKNK